MGSLLVIGRFFFLAIVVLGIFVYMKGGSSRAATAVISQSCSDAAAGMVKVTFDWRAPAIEAQETWLDLGIAPGFPAGTFRGHGPIAAKQTTYSVEGLPAGVKLYYRINTLEHDKWHVAAAGAVTPSCAAAAKVRPTPAVDVISAGP